jgi:hypothetical protein
MTSTTSFPLVWKPNTQKVDMTKIENPLAVPKNKVKPQTMAELVSLLEDNPSIMSVIDYYKANGKTFDRNKIGSVKYDAIGKNTFNSVVQRMYDFKHGAGIAKAFDEQLLVPIMATQLTNGNYSCIDTMHGSGLVALFAKHGLWGNDPNDWENFQYPYFVIDQSDESFAPEAALARNGKGQKKWSKFDFHRVYVFMVRHFGSKDKVYVDAAKRQDLCEKYECIPLPERHKHAKKAGTQTHIGALYKHSLKATEFVLSMHKKYWHGTTMDSAAWGLYANLYESLTFLKIPTKGQAFNQFMDDFHAVIKEFFTGLAGLRTGAENAHSEWFKKSYDRKFSGNAQDDVALSIVLKIYQKLHGTHPVPGQAVAYTYQKAGVTIDIFDSLEDDIKDRINALI